MSLTSHMPISLEEITQRADALYAARAQLENVRASVELLRAAVEPYDYEVAWRLARALFFLGQEANTPEDARALHAQGVEVSARAARVRPGRVEGRFWLGVNLALSARLENPLTALPQALRARRELERAARIDSAYHGAGPLRVIGRLQHKLPRWLGGGANRARANFERAIELAPANTVTRLYFAELLIDAGAIDQARTQLEVILNAPHDPAWAFEIKRDQRLAREILRCLVIS
jgi:tetratricopeptide (TPR) repeat protein